ncbi:class II aldolase/adducin family protein [Parafrankia colletiae]|uniref:class II aldolase/adducin family protein n=1 Tax=Parafrankia colletiae TaxID=573497 RepID=UPI0021100FBD|nr:class II aldolase/adducin family protein [Parafrankia colletiae]
MVRRPCPRSVSRYTRSRRTRAHSTKTTRSSTLHGRGVFSTGESRRIATALGTKKLAILANHGLLTVGTTVESAAYWYIAAACVAQTQLVTQAAGKLR